MLMFPKFNFSFLTRRLFEKISTYVAYSICGTFMLASMVFLSVGVVLVLFITIVGILKFFEGGWVIIAGLAGISVIVMIVQWATKIVFKDVLKDAGEVNE